MSETSAGRSLAKGLAAGLVAGLVATAAKSCVEALFPPRVHGEPEPPEVLAEKVAGHALDRETKTHAGQAIHWGLARPQEQPMVHWPSIIRQRRTRKVRRLGWR